MGGVSARGLTKRFGRVLALDDVTLDVAPGEIVVVLGPNGAGKSTLLRILGTTVIPDSGEAIVAGHGVTTAPAAVRRSIGFLLADERSWYWRLTGRHNLEFFAALYRLSRRECQKRAAELLDEVGLSDAADRPFAGYSSGMRLRLSLARALLSSHQVLLLDEPTRSLDPIATKSFRTLITRTAEQRRSAVLLATHDLHEAAALASRVVVLYDGRICGVSESPGSSAEIEQMILEATG